MLHRNVVILIKIDFAKDRDKCQYEKMTLTSLLFSLYIISLVSISHSYSGHFLSFSWRKIRAFSLLRAADPKVEVNADTIKSLLARDRSQGIDPKVVEDQIDFQNINNNFHKREDDWGCMKSCGACCMLGPIELRPQAEHDLSPSDYQLYLSMIGKDNWCIHYDKAKRECSQFENRPSFCRVEKQRYLELYQLEAEEYTDFLRFCCSESIEDAYGAVSVEEYKYSRLMDLISHNPDGFDPNSSDWNNNNNSDNQKRGRELPYYQEILEDPRLKVTQREADDFHGVDEETIDTELFQRKKKLE